MDVVSKCPHWCGNMTECVGEWVTARFITDLCLRSLFVIAAGHQLAKVQRLMTLKIPSCLSRFLALNPAFSPSPLMCFKLCV